jgi:hypothetical protein
VLESTRRIIPLPGLMQASSVPALLAARIAIGTTTAQAMTEMPAMTLLRVNLIFISGLLLGRLSKGEPAIYWLDHLVSRHFWERFALIASTGFRS